MPKSVLLGHLREKAPKGWLRSYGLLSKKADKRYNVAYLLAAYRDLLGAAYQEKPTIPLSPPLSTINALGQGAILTLTILPSLLPLTVAIIYRRHKF